MELLFKSKRPSEIKCFGIQLSITITALMNRIESHMHTKWYVCLSACLPDCLSRGVQ